MKMTEAQFEYIADMIRSKDPARQGARLVILHDVPNAEAARSVGVAPQSVHRAAKRIAEVHDELRRHYKSSLHQRLAVDMIGPSNEHMQRGVRVFKTINFVFAGQAGRGVPALINPAAVLFLEIARAGQVGRTCITMSGGNAARIAVDEPWDELVELLGIEVVELKRFDARTNSEWNGARVFVAPDKIRFIRPSGDYSELQFIDGSVLQVLDSTPL